MLDKSKLKRITLTIAFSIMLAVFLSLLASPSISPIYGVYEGSNFTYDPALFKYEALAILEGQTPYIDFYDHKGIWHLGIYILAMLISKEYGLFILEIISGAITIFFYLESVKTITSSLVNRHIAIFFFIIIRFAVGTGATIGMFILPFTAAFFCFYVKAIKEEKNNLFLIGSVFLGLAVSFSLNSRPMDMVFSWGGAFFILVYSIKEKKYDVLIKNAVVAFTSFIIPVIAIAIIALSNGFFNEMLQAVFLDNFKYVSTLDEKYMEKILFMALSTVLLGLFVLFYLIRRKTENNNNLDLFLFVMGVSSFLPLMFLVKFFSHFLGSVPLLGITLTYCLETASKGKEIKKKIFISLTASIATILALTPVAYYTFGIVDFSYSKNEKDLNALRNSIPEEDRISGNIYAVDCSCQVYHVLGVVSDSKYYCNQTWWSYDNPTIMDEALTYVKESKPKYVILWKETLDDKWETILSQYSLIDESAARFYIYKINV